MVKPWVDSTASGVVYLPLCDTPGMSPRPLIFLACCLLVLIGSCGSTYQWDGSLESLLRSQPERFATVMQNVEQHRVQIIYTQIDRDAENRPTFTSFTYRVDPAEYFYPASTVKLPTALLALEKLQRLSIDGLGRDTAMLTGAANASQTPAPADASSVSTYPSIGHYIRKILLVSDNDAFNRLYEFLGQAPLNDALATKGFSDTRIIHRLEVSLSLDQNRSTNPVQFRGEDVQVYAQEALYSSQSYAGKTPVLLGRAEIVDGILVQRPKDFAEKNAFALQDLHDVVKVLMFPDSMPAHRRFGLSEDDYRFVYRNMSAYPADSGISDYADRAEYPDGYVKFLMYGGRAEHIPANIRIYNKVGDAYGFLTDAAYVIDSKQGVEFLLAATLYVNANATFNDNNYEYDEIGLPFLRDLGQAIVEIELARHREHRPDFSRLTSIAD